MYTAAVLCSFLLLLFLFCHIVNIFLPMFFIFAFFERSRSPRALSPTDTSRENIETTFDLEGNVETISTASGAREDNRSLGSSSENR